MPAPAQRSASAHCSSLPYSPAQPLLLCHHPWLWPHSHGGDTRAGCSLCPAPGTGPAAMFTCCWDRREQGQAPAPPCHPASPSGASAFPCAAALGVCCCRAGSRALCAGAKRGASDKCQKEVSGGAGGCPRRAEPGEEQESVCGFIPDCSAGAWAWGASCLVWVCFLGGFGWFWFLSSVPLPVLWAGRCLCPPSPRLCKSVSWKRQTWK